MKFFTVAGTSTNKADAMVERKKKKKTSDPPLNPMMAEIFSSDNQQMDLKPLRQNTHLLFSHP